jgi:anaerobic magnesium-protoporphyrin IX monomethyl ester cyclase
MLDTLLIHPVERGLDTGKNAHGGMPPLGMLWIVSYLEQKGYAVDIIDCQIDTRNIEDYIKREKPKLIGIGGTSHTRFDAFKIAKEVKKTDPNIRVIYGGAHATFTAEDTLKNIPEVDIIVRGEGEETTLEISKAIINGKSEIKDILGISYRDNSGNIIHNGERPRIQDLDSLPFPARHKVDMSKYHMEMDHLNITGTSVMTSRGCPVNCSYCSASAMFGRSLTLRSAKNVLDEVEELVKQGYKGIKFFDSTLTLRKSHILSICDEFKKRGLTNVPWECEVRVNTVSKELLTEMKEAGCYLIDFGVESASPKVLKDMHKGITIEQVEKTLDWAEEIGLKTKVFFTFGHIRDSYKTFDFIRKHKHQITQTGGGVGIKVYPGTQVERFAQENNLLPDNFSWSAPYCDMETDFFWGHTHIPMLLQPGMGYQELRQLRYKLILPKLLNPVTLISAVINVVKSGNLVKIWQTIKGIYKTKVRQYVK